MTADEGITWELCEFYLPKKGRDEVIFVLRKVPISAEQALAQFDSVLETLLERENGMKALIRSFKEKEMASSKVQEMDRGTQKTRQETSGRSLPKRLLPPLGLRKLWNRLKRVMAESKSDPAMESPPPVETKKARSAYKATWNDLSQTEDRAKMHVTGYVEEDRIQSSAEETKNVLLKTLGIGPGDMVLEIGCGIGRVGRVIAPLCKEWIGCDVSTNMLQHAAERLKDYGNVRFVELSGYDLKPIPDQSVDVVYCTVVFMHLEEWDRYQYVLEAHRVLRPGGRIYIDNINLCGEEGWAVFDRHRGARPEKRPAHISVTSTPQEIEMYLKKAGFQSVTIENHTLWARGWGRK
ncbi:MAG: class I SAM-dependent methyltransferase [Nitrospirae bacterium]|nr:class I SAM-dependent methyltransferase [Nitrospirota bacterium]